MRWHSLFQSIFKAAQALIAMFHQMVNVLLIEVFCLKSELVSNIVLCCPNKINDPSMPFLKDQRWESHMATDPGYTVGTITKFTRLPHGNACTSSEHESLLVNVFRILPFIRRCSLRNRTHSTSK